MHIKGHLVVFCNYTLFLGAPYSILVAFFFFFKETWDLNIEMFHLEAHLMKGNRAKLKNQCVHTCEWSWL